MFPTIVSDHVTEYILQIMHRFEYNTVYSLRAEVVKLIVNV